MLHWYDKNGELRSIEATSFDDAQDSNVFLGDDGFIYITVLEEIHEKDAPKRYGDLSKRYMAQYVEEKVSLQHFPAIERMGYNSEIEGQDFFLYGVYRIPQYIVPIPNKLPFQKAYKTSLLFDRAQEEDTWYTLDGYVEDPALTANSYLASAYGELGEFAAFISDGLEEDGNPDNAQSYADFHPHNFATDEKGRFILLDPLVIE